MATSSCFSTSAPHFEIHPLTESYLFQALSKKELVKGKEYDVATQALFKVAISASVSKGLEKEAELATAELKKKYGDGAIVVLTAAIKVEEAEIKKNAQGCVVS